MQHSVRNHNSRGGNYERSSNYGHPQRQQQSSWQPDASSSDSLNELNMQLEMVKRKRQMLLEQQQLMKAQQQLELLQSQRNASIRDTQRSRQFYSQPQQSYNQYSNYENRYNRAANGEQRGFKRPAKPSVWQVPGQPKRFAPATYAPEKNPAASPLARERPPKPSQHGPSASWLNRTVDPVHPGTPLFLGEENSSRSTKNKINTAINFIMREIKQLFFCPPRKVEMENYQYHAMRTRIIDRVHQLLMNKPVVSSLAIHQMYRKTHTAKGDLRLIQAMLALTQEECNLVTLKRKIVQSAKAEPKTVVKETHAKNTVAKDTNDPGVTDNMKEKFQKIFDAKLTDIFEKISKIYAEESAENETIEDAVDAEMADQPKAKEADDPKPTAQAETSAETEGALKTESKEESAVSPTGVEKKELSEQQVVAFDFMVDTSVRSKMPQFLPRFKGIILSIMARDPEFAEFDIKPEEKPVQMDSLKFVKVFGRPILPPRPLMQQFLCQFKPVSVKKHKTVQNLVVVGLSDDNFQSLMRHNGHTIGTKRLDMYAGNQDSTKKTNATSEDKKEEINCETKTKDVNIAEDVHSTLKPTEVQVISLNSDEQKESLMDAIQNLDNEIDELLATINESEDAYKQENVDKNAEDVEDTVETHKHSKSNVEESGKNTEEYRGNADETEESIEERVNADETVDCAEKSNENSAETGKVEDEDQKTVGIVEKTGDSLGETGIQIEEKIDKFEKSKAEEVKAPHTPSGIRTRRSSRLPQNK